MVRILLIQETDWKDKGPHQQHHIIERLVRRGHQARIIDYDIAWPEKSVDRVISEKLDMDLDARTIDGIKTHLIRPRMLRMPVLCYLSVLAFHTVEILRQIKKFRPQVILGMSILNSFVGLVYSKLLGIPFVYYWIDSYHDLIPESFLRRIGKIVEKFILKRSDLVMAINDRLAEYQVSLGAKADRVHTIPAGVVFERFNPKVDGSHIRKRYGVDPKDTLLLFMGWMYEFSGLREVARDIASVSDDKPVKLLLVGKGDIHEELLNLSKEPTSKNRIIMVDWVHYKDLPQYVAASDVCLLPAYLNDIMRHIVPIKLYEYMACGKPVVVTKLPGIMKEFRTGNGIIYVDRPDDAVACAMQLVESGEDKRIGRAAGEFAKKRNWEPLVDRFYNAIVQASAKF